MTSWVHRRSHPAVHRGVLGPLRPVCEVVPFFSPWQVAYSGALRTVQNGLRADCPMLLGRGGPSVGRAGRIRDHIGSRRFSAGPFGKDAQ